MRTALPYLALVLVAGVGGTVWSLNPSALWADGDPSDPHVSEKPGITVSNEGEEKAEKIDPGVVEETKVADYVEIEPTTTLIQSLPYNPPIGWAFNPFPQANPWDYVDIHNKPPDAIQKEVVPPTSLNDTAGRVQIEGLFYNASVPDWPLRCEGNLKRLGGGGGGPQEWYWAAKARGQLEIHPQEVDFEPGKAGRVIISNKWGTPYWTVVKTAKNDQPAQQADRTVKITAYVRSDTPTAGITVYFRVMDPDPDDPSSYEPDADKGDNRDGVLSNKAGVLSAASATTEVVTINGQVRAAAEVELTITNRHAGDNYIVEASLENTFPEGKTMQTCLLTAWKRIYFERDRMYKKGATVAVTFVPDQDEEPDKIWVDCNDDFNQDDVVVFFRPGGLICETTVLLTGSEYGLPYIKVPDMTAAVSQYDGVKLKGNDDTYDDVDLRYFGQCYGDDPRGDEHAGCFVEYSTPVNGSGPIPKYSELIGHTVECRNFLNNWFHNRFFKENCFYLVSVGQADRTAWAEQDYHFCVCSIEKMMSTFVDWEIARDEIACHEIGHQFVASGGHVDTNDPVWNHDHSDYCIMSYAQDPENEIVEFCTDHCYEVRDDVDPRQ